MRSHEYYGKLFSTMEEMIQDTKHERRDIMIGLLYLYGQLNIIRLLKNEYIPYHENNLLKHLKPTISNDILFEVSNRKFGINPNVDSSLQIPITQKLGSLDIQKVRNNVAISIQLPDLMKGEALNSNTFDFICLVEAMLNMKEVDEKSLKSFFSFYSQKPFQICDFSLLFETLLICQENDVLFIRKCLQAFQAAYNDCLQENQIANLLFVLPILFIVFNNCLAQYAVHGLEYTLRIIEFELGEKEFFSGIEYENYLTVLRLIKTETFNTDDIKRLAQQFWEMPLTFIELISLVGQRAVPVCQKIVPREILYLPPQLQVKFQQLDDSPKSDFLFFLKQYHDCDQTVALTQRRPIALFLTIMANKIIQLIDIMGSCGVAYMHRQLDQATLTIERKLENLSLLDDSLIAPLATYYQKQNKDHNTDEAFFNCLILMDVYYQHYLKHQAENTDLLTQLDKKPSELLTWLENFPECKVKMLSLQPQVIEASTPPIVNHALVSQTPNLHLEAKDNSAVMTALSTSSLAVANYPEEKTSFNAVKAPLSQSRVSKDGFLGSKQLQRSQQQARRENYQHKSHKCSIS